MSKAVSIPDFTEGDIRSMSTSLRAVKQILEGMTGQRQDESKGSPAVYVQTTEPRAGRNFFSIGDFWINSNTKVLSYWTGNYWQVVV